MEEKKISRDKGSIIYTFLSPRSNLLSNRQSLTTKIFSSFYYLQPESYIIIHIFEKFLCHLVQLSLSYS